MQAVQQATLSPPPFRSQMPSPPRTLDDMRMVHDNYATSGSFSASAMRPVLIAVLVIAAIAGIAFGAKTYSARNDAKINSAALAPALSVPAASSVPPAPIPAGVPTATDSPATSPLSSLTKPEESNSMPMAGHGNNHSSESMNPVKAKSVAPKSAAISTKRMTPPVAPAIDVTPLQSIAPPQQEAVPPSPLTPMPAPAPIVEPPVVPVPVVPPAEPTKL